MNVRSGFTGLVVCLVLAGTSVSRAASYYINDTNTVGDIYTTIGGNDANNGLTPGTPKLTLGNLIGTTGLVPGDVVYIDTGSYAPAVISNTVAGAAGNPIVFQGSTNGTVFTGGGVILAVGGSHLTISHLRGTGRCRGN
jgi:hypothetical protein